jgi:hypothetical protein
MKVYILKDKDGEFKSYNFAIAYEGFRRMGWEIFTFTQADNALLPDLKAEDVVVGYIETIHTALLKCGIIDRAFPPLNDYYVFYATR